MKKPAVTIKEDCLDDAILVSQQIPEFENTYQLSKYKKRLKGIKHLILTAYVNNKAVGFKVGYETPTKQNFYS